MSDNTETAILAGGCFWGVQELLRQRDGVISTRVGYTGGENDNPTYANHPGHAEAVEIAFDTERISYRDILFLVGASLFQWSTTGAVNPRRLAAAALIVGLAFLGAQVSALALAVIVTALLIALAISELRAATPVGWASRHRTVST